MNKFIHRQAIGVYQRLTGRRILERWDELNRSQWSSRAELDALQRRKLQRLLTYAYEHVPYYHRVLGEAGLDPARFDLEHFRRLPLLTKALVREHYDDLITEEAQRRKTLSQLSTGGSTGQPLVFMQDNNFRDFVTADLLRHLGWADWELGQPHAYLWGTSFEVGQSQSRRGRLMDLALNRFVVNAYIFSEANMAAFVRQIRRRRPRLLFGYASSLYHFALYVRRRKVDDLHFHGIFSSAEVLYPHQRQTIEEAFGCRVFDRYGARELGGIGCECQAHAGFHLSVENNYVEILQNGEPVGPGEIGHIVVTNLNNYGMPFIRYQTGDMGAWQPDHRCSCGRELPMLKVVQGRQMNLFRSRDGHVIWGGFIRLVFELPGVRRFQIVQKSLDRIVIYLVHDGPPEQAALDKITRTIRATLGPDAQVQFEFLDEIPPRPSGKYLYVISELGEESA